MKSILSLASFGDIIFELLTHKVSKRHLEKKFVKFRNNVELAYIFLYSLFDPLCFLHFTTD
jgi:hypothetical protein